MSWLTPEFAVQISLTVAAVGVVYGGIRADLRNIMARMEKTERLAARAHDRIDRLLQQ